MTSRVRLLLASSHPGPTVTVTVLATVLAAVHHAEVVAERVGEPFGTLILALAVTVIETGLIVSLMLSNPESAAALARDTVFAASMIILNLLLGLCLIAAGRRELREGNRVEQDEREPVPDRA